MRFWMMSALIVMLSGCAGPTQKTMLWGQGSLSNQQSPAPRLLIEVQSRQGVNDPALSAALRDAVRQQGVDALSHAAVGHDPQSPNSITKMRELQAQAVTHVLLVKPVAQCLAPDPNDIYQQKSTPLWVAWAAPNNTSGPLGRQRCWQLSLYQLASGDLVWTRYSRQPPTVLAAWYQQYHQGSASGANFDKLSP